MLNTLLTLLTSLLASFAPVNDDSNVSFAFLVVDSTYANNFILYLIAELWLCVFMMLQQKENIYLKTNRNIKLDPFERHNNNIKSDLTWNRWGKLTAGFHLWH